MYDYLLRRKSTWKKKLALCLLIVIAFFTGIIVGSLAVNETVVPDFALSPENAGERDTFTDQVSFGAIPDAGMSSFAAIRIPAVGQDEEGVLTTLTVQVVPGSGRILTNIDKLLFWVDTQSSIRKATSVAENITGIDLADYDIIYGIQANASVIGGPSAGAAITLATIAALENRTINESVMITGSVNHDGTIGPVGGVVEKALISKEVGAQTFLVPLTQAAQVSYKTRQYCEKIGWMDFCTTETYPVKVDVEADAGIDVVEVMTIRDAMGYMVVDK